MRKSKPQPSQNVVPFEFAPEQEKLEIPAFRKIDGSPVPGVTLRQVLQGHKGRINRLAWSPMAGGLLAAPSTDQILIWDVQRGESWAVLDGYNGYVNTVSWSPDGQRLASSFGLQGVRTWDLTRRKPLWESKQHKGWVGHVAWSHGGHMLASGAQDNAIVLWEPGTGEPVATLKGHDGYVNALAWSPSDSMVASGSADGTTRLWSPKTGELLFTLKGRNANTVGAIVTSVAWTPDERFIAAGSVDGRISIWDIEKTHLSILLEGHTRSVNSVDFSADGRLLASMSEDQIRMWRTDTWMQAAQFSPGRTKDPDLRFHPSLPVLATHGEKSDVVLIWDLDLDRLLGSTAASPSVRYTSAKLVLVGDSGVGKTGLGWRLAHGKFKEHASTHGQQFWAISDLCLKRADGTECEAVLWDLAGQHVYRQIHSIFLENVAFALLLFDPTNRQEPLKGVQFWLEQLKGNGQLPPAVLIGARVDRGAPALADQELQQFCQRYGIRGGYVSTSARSGEGMPALLKMLKAQIPWQEMTATVTTITFKRIKDYVLALKERPDRNHVLVSPAELSVQLQATDPDWSFTVSEMMKAVSHLETHGYVAILSSSAGEQNILLAPDLLVTLASSIVLLADKHPRELGAISETELLSGRYSFDELAGLSPTETQILLDAAIFRFLNHNICFRETLGDDALLIFPGLIKQKRPLQDELSAVDNISYVVRGRVGSLYASLVVLLGYTPSFTRINQWQNQAQYEMGEAEICGFRLTGDREGEVELVLYYSDQLPAYGRVKFQELFEQFLYRHNVEVTRFPPVACANGHQQNRVTVIERVRELKTFMFCDECGDKITLPDFEKPQSIGIGASPWLQREEAVARLLSAYEVQLTKVKGYRRGWATPRCYLSHHPDQATWVNALVRYLREAGVYVIEHTEEVRPDDFVIVVDTPAYQKAFGTHLLATDARLIRERLNRKSQLMSLALTGRPDGHGIDDCEPGNFCDETHYPVSLFDLVLNLYAIPLTHAGFKPARKTLHEQWEQTLVRKDVDHTNSPLKIFISYSHKDEAFKDELVTMLAGLKRRGIVDAWQDRRIEPGDEWNQAIQGAMNDCDLALLLVSADYLASRFIQEEEQPKLLQRWQEVQLRVIPIVVRPCKWQSEPVLKDLQVLPRDNRAVIKFSKTTGARDQVWTDIATVIETRAKARTTR
jgi:WD40 repeat protein